MRSLRVLIERIPEGYTIGLFRNKKYGITKQTFNDGKSFKVFGKELEGADFISLNYYVTKKQDLLRPCEMPQEKVIEFLHELNVI